MSEKDCGHPGPKLAYSDLPGLCETCHLRHLLRQQSAEVETLRSRLETHSKIQAEIFEWRQAWKEKAEEAQAALTKQKAESAELLGKAGERIKAEHELYLCAHRENMKGATLLMESDVRLKQAKERIIQLGISTQAYQEYYGALYAAWEKSEATLALLAKPAGQDELDAALKREDKMLDLGAQYTNLELSDTMKDRKILACAYRAQVVELEGLRAANREWLTQEASSREREIAFGMIETESELLLSLRKQDDYTYTKSIGENLAKAVKRYKAAALSVVCLIPSKDSRVAEAMRLADDDGRAMCETCRAPMSALANEVKRYRIAFHKCYDAMLKDPSLPNRTVLETVQTILCDDPKCQNKHHETQPS